MVTPVREHRIHKVRTIIDAMHVDGCLIRGMENIFYLTGFTGSEGTLLVTHGSVVLCTDFRYITHAQESTRNITIVEVRDRDSSLRDICAQHGIKKLGFDSLHTSYDMYSTWSEKLSGIELVPLGHSIEEIRTHKEAEEVATIGKAVDIATKAFMEILRTMAPGRTEKDVVNELEYTMRRFGADGPSFNTIVASGVRAALPHAEPTDKKISHGEAVIIDFGVRYGGYCSDETCTVCVGTIDGEMRKLLRIVHEARSKGIEAIRVGMKLKELDTIVRGHIDNAGYGKFFRHGVGHGIGIAVHEAPAITSTAEGTLEEHMVITIEPGIYIPNVGGVRLEDMVLVTDTGAEILTHMSKDMLQV